jgi:membrane protease YdiL (CAAX protease family)
MTIPAVGPSAQLGRVHLLLRSGALTAGFAAAVALRVAIGGPAAPTSLTAGLAFAGCLLLLSAIVGVRVTATPHDALIGLAGAALICAPAVLARLAHPPVWPTFTGFTTWASVACVVATAEEIFLRGALYNALHASAGTVAAIVGAAIAFALLHVPLYGWQVLPLDLAVGLVLGLLRYRAGSCAAPAVAHVMADLAGWFLR